MYIPQANVASSCEEVAPIQWADRTDQSAAGHYSTWAATGSQTNSKFSASAMSILTSDRILHSHVRKRKLSWLMHKYRILVNLFDSEEYVYTLTNWFIWGSCIQTHCYECFVTHSFIKGDPWVMICWLTYITIAITIFL